MVFRNNLGLNLSGMGYTPANFSNLTSENNAGYNCANWASVAPGTLHTLLAWQTDHRKDLLSFIPPSNPVDDTTPTYFLLRKSGCIGVGFVTPDNVTSDYWQKIPSGNGKVDIGAFQLQRNW